MSLPGFTISNVKYCVDPFLAELPRLTHRVVQIVGMENEVKNHETIQPSSVCTLKKDDPDPTKKEYYELDFKLGKATTKNDICVYYMQVCPHQQDFENKKIEELIGESNRKWIPERILQSVHGYVNLRTDHPTRIHLGRQWDKTTVSSLQSSLTNSWLIWILCEISKRGSYVFWIFSN